MYLKIEGVASDVFRGVAIVAQRLYIHNLILENGRIYGEQYSCMNSISGGP